MASCFGGWGRVQRNGQYPGNAAVWGCRVHRRHPYDALSGQRAKRSAALWPYGRPQGAVTASIARANQTTTSFVDG